jgi:hypothetical protein
MVNSPACSNAAMNQMLFFLHRKQGEEPFVIIL